MSRFQEALVATLFKDCHELDSVNRLLERCFKCLHDQLLKKTQGAQFFTGKVDLQVSAASSAAIEAIEQNGGSIQTMYHSKETLAWMAAPHKYAIPPKGLELPPTKALLGIVFRITETYFFSEYISHLCHPLNRVLHARGQERLFGATRPRSRAKRRSSPTL